MKRRVNVWILNHYAVPPEFKSGTRHFDLARRMKESNINVTIFSSNYIHNLCDFAEKGITRYQVSTYDGIKFCWIKTSPYGKKSLQRVMNMAEYSIKMLLFNFRFSKPDIIIGSSVHPLAVLSAYILSKRYKCKMIFEIRDLWPETLVKIGGYSYSNIVIKVMYMLERFLLKKSDIVVILFEKARKYIEKHGGPIDKIRYIPNGVSIADFDLNANRYTSSLVRVDDMEILVAYTGAMGEANQLDTIISAAKILMNGNENNYTFHLVGDGNRKKEIEEKIMKEKITNIKLHKSVDKRKIPSILISSDILIITMKKSEIYEYGMSLNKLYDYMASGKPIIFSAEVPDNPVYISKCGYTVSPEKPEEIVSALKEFSKLNLKEREQMGIKGRQYVAKYHNMDTLADSYIHEIDELLSSDKDLYKTVI